MTNSTNETAALVVIEPVETIDNERMQLSLKCENFNLHGLQTLKCLDAMRKERQLCDVILTVEGHELFVHRAVLSCHSNYFLELFVNDEKDISTKKQMYYQIDGVEYTVLSLIVQFIYRGSLQLTSDMVPKVYLAAHQLRIETIFKACSNHLAEQLNKYNCLTTRLLAIDDDLRMKATEFIQNNFFSVIETREFHALLSIKVELVGAAMLNTNLMCDLIINWINQQARKDNSKLQELGEYMHLLYLNGDKTLHDCSDMDKKNIFFSDLIKDYQSYKLTKRSVSSSSNKSNENLLLTTPLNFKPTNNSITLNGVHTCETKLIQIDQSSEHSYIAIAMVRGNMISITIHNSLTSSPSPGTYENGHITYSDDSTDNDNSNNRISPTSMMNKELSFSSLSIPRCCFGVVSTNENIFVVGGYDRGDCLDTMEKFDPIEGTWKLLSIPMTTRRGRVSAAMVNNRIYVYGGSDGQQELSTGEYFDLTTMNKWMPINDLDIPVAHGAMCSDELYVYLIGGCEGDKCKSDCYRYDPQTDEWSPLNPMNCERSQAAAVYYDGKIYVFGGYRSSRCLSSCEILTLSTNEWTVGPPMRENRRGCGAVVYEDKVLIIGGSNGISSLTSIEIFDPITNEWLINVNGLPSELNVPRVGVGITVCNDTLYAMGGFDGRNFLKSVEIYDKSNHRWKLTANNKSDKPCHQNGNDMKL